MRFTGFSDVSQIWLFDRRSTGAFISQTIHNNNNNNNHNNNKRNQTYHKKIVAGETDKSQIQTIHPPGGWQHQSVIPQTETIRRPGWMSGGQCIINSIPATTTSSASSLAVVPVVQPTAFSHEMLAGLNCMYVCSVPIVTCWGSLYILLDYKNAMTVFGHIESSCGMMQKRRSKVSMMVEGRPH